MKLEELALKLNSGNTDSELLRDLANFLLKKGDIDSANTVLSFLCKISPSIENIILYSDSLISTNKVEQISKGASLLNEILNKVILSSEYSFEVRKLLGNAYTKLGDSKTARVFYDNCLRIDDSSDDIYSNIGIMLYQNSDIDNAFLFFEKAIQINDKNTAALTGLALIFMDKNLYEEALKKLTMVLNLEPNNIVALNTMVNVAVKNNDFSGVLFYLEKYLQIDSLNADILYTYAVALYRTGNVEQAKFELDKILIFDPEHFYADELKQIINMQDQKNNNMEVLNNG